jgi:hypothetical protein
LSFFDDDEDELPPTTIRRSAGAPRPARPSRPAARAGTRAVGRPPPHDPHTVIVRRRVAAGAGLAVLIALIVGIAVAAGGGDREALEKYNADVGAIARESNEQVSTPFFQALSSARGEQTSNVEARLDGLREEAERETEKASKLSVPEAARAAQRYLLEVLDLRSEGLTKVSGRIGVALGGQGESAEAYKEIAGAMEAFLASDVLYSQRVVPLVQEALAQAGAQGQGTQPSRFLPNLGWLEPATVTARAGGHVNTGQSAGTGNVGSALTGVSVGSNALAPPPELNHVHSGANPTFTVNVEDAGASSESNLSVSVSVTAAGKQYTAYGTIASISAGQTQSVNIPVEGLPLNTGAKVVAEVEPVPGESDVENNKATYEVVFS